MSETALKLLEQVMALPPDDQAEFSRQLLDAEFDAEEETEAEATARWEADLERRLAEVADGSAESLPLADAMAQARAEPADRPSPSSNEKWLWGGGVAARGGLQEVGHFPAFSLTAFPADGIPRPRNVDLSAHTGERAMRRFFLLAGVGLGLTGGAAMGQQMPGQFVGKPLVTPVGTQLPQAGTRIPKVGTPPPGYAGLTGSGSPYAPPQPVIDKSLIVGPVPTTMPGAQGTTPSYFDTLYNRWLTLFGLGTPVATQRNWTPGLGRRNRERREALWRRD